MQSKMTFIVLAFVAVIGVYLLGDGITGLVISKSCCFPPDCPQEYLCDAAEPHVESPAPMIEYLWGIMIILAVAAFIFTVFHHNKHRK